MPKMEKEFWDKKWENQQTGWDIGYTSTPIKAYFDLLSNKGLKILIPGCGNAYEAEYLFKKGFRNVHVIDISKHAIGSFKERYPDFPEEQLTCGDFFEIKDQLL